MTDYVYVRAINTQYPAVNKEFIKRGVPAYINEHGSKTRIYMFESRFQDQFYHERRENRYYLELAESKEYLEIEGTEAKNKKGTLLVAIDQ